MIIYEEIFKDFQKNKVKYIVVGGLALNLHGSMRNTIDLDVLVEMSDENLKKIISLLKKRGYKVRQPVNPMKIADKKTREMWIKEKKMKAFNFYLDGDFKEVDLIIKSPISYEKATKSVFHVKIGSLVIPVISIDHLIVMKKKAGRDIDKVDIKDLKKIKKLRAKNAP